MKLIVTGGGTGGHVFPALELGLLGKERGADVLYFGSSRGQEVAAAPKAGLPFTGFPSSPVWSLRSVRGWQGLAGMARSQILAKSALRKAKPDVVFATGGYSSAPVVSASLSLKIPVVMLVMDSIPARSNKIFAKRCRFVASGFFATAKSLREANVVRTGLPVRRELRGIADGPHARELLPLILAFGGSQGAKAINEAVLGAATRMHGQALHWLHLTGKTNFEEVFASFEKLGLAGSYEPKSFLDAEEMGRAYTRATVAVTRGGAGTLAELAAFRLPAVAIPYPTSHADHQLHNVREFAEMGAVTLLVQSELHPATLERELRAWLDDDARRERAAEAMAQWDVPDATDRIWKLIVEAAD